MILDEHRRSEEMRRRDNKTTDGRQKIEESRTAQGNWKNRRYNERRKEIYKKQNNDEEGQVHY